MKRTTAPNNQSNKYVDQTGSVPGTSLVAEDRNLIQEEICNLLEGFGITLDGADDEQIKDLMQDYLNQKLKSTDDVTHNNIVSSGTLTANGILKANDYFQMRTAVSYSTGLLVGGLSAMLPIGWYIVNDSNTVDYSRFETSSGKFIFGPSTNTGGLIYSDGTRLIRNVSGSDYTFSLDKY